MPVTHLEYVQSSGNTWETVLVVALLGAWRWPRLAGSMLAFIALRSLLLVILESPEPRYTLECFPLIFIFAAVALATSPGGWFRARS